MNCKKDKMRFKNKKRASVPDFESRKKFEKKFVIIKRATELVSILTKDNFFWLGTGYFRDSILPNMSKFIFGGKKLGVT